MKYLFLLLLSLSAFAKDPIRVVVLDSGLDLKDERFQGVLCKDGHKDFTGTGIKDTNGHGTHIASIIMEYAKDADYCLVIVKYYDETKHNNTETYLDAVAYLDGENIQVVNISGGGPKILLREHLFIAENTKTKFFVAAGNDNKDLDKTCSYYPACYKKLKNKTVVGSKCNTFKSKFSNYGTIINSWECGEQVLGNLPDGTIGKYSGTSQATAIATGKYIYKLTH